VPDHLYFWKNDLKPRVLLLYEPVTCSPVVAKADIEETADEMVTPNGSFAEYAIAWAASTFHLPKRITFEEVRLATLNGTAMT